MPEGYEKYIKPILLKKKGPNRFNPEYSSPRYEEEKRFSLIFPEKPDTGIKDIITASREKNFNEEKILDEARREQVPIDPITSGIVKNTVAPIGEAFNTISKGAGNIGLGFNKAGATGDYSQLGEGGIELLQGLLHTAFTPFTVPYGGITGGLRGSGEVGSEIATGLDRTMQLPFDVINKGSELTQQGLNTLGYNPQNESGLETKADELLRELAGLVLLKKAHTGAKDIVNREPLPNIIKGEKQPPVKPNDVKQQINVDPKQVNPETGFTDFNFKPNQTKPVKGTTQERTPLQIATELLNENRKAPEKNIKKNTPVKTSIKTKEVSKTSTDQLKQQETLDNYEVNNVEIPEGIENEQGWQTKLIEKAFADMEVKPKKIEAGTGTIYYDFESKDGDPIKVRLGNHSKGRWAGREVDANVVYDKNTTPQGLLEILKGKLPDGKILKSKTSKLETFNLPKESDLEKIVEDSNLIFNGIQKTNTKQGDFVTWTDPKTQSTHLTPIKEFTTEKIIADRDRFRKDWEEASKQTKTQSTPSKDRIVEPTGETKVEKQPYELNKSEFSQKVYSGKIDFEIPIAEKNIKFLVDNYHKTTDKQNKQLAKEEIDKFIDREHSSSVDVAISEGKIESHPDYPELTTGKSDKQPLEMTTDELNQEFNAYSDKLTKAEKYAEKSDTNIGNLSTPEQMLAPKDAVRFDEVRNELIKRETEIAKQKVTESRKNRLGEQNIKESAFNNLQWTDETPTRKRQLLKEAQSQAEQLRQQGINAKIERKKSGKGWNLTIDGKPQGKRELGLVERPEKGKLEDVKVSKEVEKPFRNEQEQKVTLKVAEAFTSAEDLPTGFGKKAHEKAIEDIRKDEGSELNPEAKIIRDRVNTILKEGAEIKNQRGESATSFIEPEQIKEFVNEKSLEELSIEGESFDLTAPETKVRKKKPEQLKMEGLGQAKMPDKAITGKGKGEETTPLFNQPKVVKGQEKLFIESEAQGDRLTELKAQLKDYEERKRLFAPDKGLGINNTSNYDRLIKETKDEIESERKKVDRYVTEYPELNEQPKEVKGQENLFEKKPFEMTSNEWNKAREELKPEIAQQNFTKGSESQAVSRTNKLIDLLYDVNKQAQQKLKDAQEGKIKLSEEETNNLLEQINSKVTHKQIVEKALREGKEVPTNVLSEYPELKQMKRVISDEVLQAARDNIKNKLNRLNTGIDPTLIKDYAVIGAYHLESVIISGAKKGKEFRDWAKEMMVDLGEDIRPHLRTIWNEVQKDKEFITRLYPKEKAVKEVIEQPKVVETKVEKTTGIKNAVVNKEENTWKNWLEQQPNVELVKRKVVGVNQEGKQGAAYTQKTDKGYKVIYADYTPDVSFAKEVGRVLANEIPRDKIKTFNDEINNLGVKGDSFKDKFAGAVKILAADPSLTKNAPEINNFLRDKNVIIEKVSSDIKSNIPVLPKNLTERKKISEKFKSGVEGKSHYKSLSKFTNDGELNEYFSKIGENIEKPRGVMSREAVEGLASELGLSKKDILGLKQGDIRNVEQLTGMRQVVIDNTNELQKFVGDNPGKLSPEKADQLKNMYLTNRVMITKIMGLASETGRALQSLNRKMDAREFDLLSDIYDKLQESGIKDIKSPKEFNKKIKEILEPTIGDKAVYWWYNSLLFNPLTDVANLTGNSTYLGAELISRSIWEPQNTKQIIKGVAGGWKDFKKDVQGIWNAEQQQIAKYDFDTNQLRKNYDPNPNSIQNQLLKNILKGGRILLPINRLRVEDALFRNIAKNIERETGIKNLTKKYKEADNTIRNELIKIETTIKNEQLGKDLTEREKSYLQTIEDYENYGKDLTFTHQLGKTGQLFQKVTNSNAFLKWLFPFIRISVNLTKEGLKQTPYYVGKSLIKEGVGKLTGKQYEGNFSNLTPRQKNTMLRRAIVGSTALTSLSYLISQGSIEVTGDGPKNKKQKDEWLAMGYKPNHIYFGNTGIPYSNINPYGILLSIVGNLSDQQKYDTKFNNEDNSIDEKLSLLTGKLANTFMSQSFMWGLETLYKSIEYGDTNLLNKILTSPLPNIGGIIRGFKGDFKRYKMESLGDVINYKLGLSELGIANDLDVDKAKGESPYRRFPFQISEKKGILSPNKEMQSISNKQFEVSKLKDKALETRSKEDVKAYRKAQLELKQMRTKSKDYQNDLKDKRKKRLEQKNLLN